VNKREEYEYLLERSRRFYETALLQIDRGFYDLAAFSLEHSLQLYLEGISPEAWGRLPADLRYEKTSRTGTEGY